MKLFSIKSILVLGAIVLAQTSASNATTIFSDNFTGGADTLWLEEYGNWVTFNDQYGTTSFENLPNTNSLVNITLTDFELNVDVFHAGEAGGHGGGIWLRSSTPEHDTIDGVLLAWSGGAMYWHDVTTPGEFTGDGSPQNVVYNVYDGGDDFSIKIVVEGDMYSAYLNGSSTAITTLVSGEHSSGFAGLYNYQSQQWFDDFSIETVNAVPVPAALPLFGTGLLLMGILGYRRKRRDA